MSDFQSIGHRFMAVAQAHEAFPVIQSDGDMTTYGQLRAMAAILASRLEEDGVREGSIVALSTGEMRVSLSMLFATSLLGAGFVIAGRVLEKSNAVQPTHRYRTADARVARPEAFSVIDDSLFTGKSADKALARIDAFGGGDPDTNWLYLHTSGTTGRPKYIALSNRVVAARTQAVKADFRYASTTMGTLFGVTSRPFYARAIGALLSAGSIVEGTDFDTWVRMGVNYACASPLQAANILVQGEPVTQKLPLIEVSGAKLSEDLARTLLGRFERVTDIYGASETNKSYATEVSLATDGSVLRSGRPVGSEIEIIDDDGQPLGREAIGRVRVRNNFIASGYIGEPEATANSFLDGWFLPGDWARWTQNGTLEVIGRSDDVVSIGGFKVNVNLVDLVIRIAPGVADAIAFRNPKPSSQQELVAYVQFEDLVNRQDVLKNVRDQLEEHLGIAFPVGNLHHIDLVPRDEFGEPMRRLCQEMLLDRVATKQANETE